MHLEVLTEQTEPSRRNARHINRGSDEVPPAGSKHCIALDVDKLNARETTILSQRDNERTYDVLSCIISARRKLSFSELSYVLSVASKIFTSPEQTKELHQEYIETALREGGGLFASFDPKAIISFEPSRALEFLNTRYKSVNANRIILHGHALLARACLHQPLSPSLIPDFCANTSLPSGNNNNSWQEYASQHWKTHYLAAEAHDKALTGLLHHALTTRYSQAFNVRASKNVSRLEFIAQHVLAFSVAHGLMGLMQISLSMGTDPTKTFCSRCLSPLALAKTTGNVEVVDIIRGFRGSQRPHEGSARTRISSPTLKVGEKDSMALLLRCRDNMTEIGEKHA